MRSTAGSRAVAPKRLLRRYLTTGKVGEMLEVSPAAIKKWIQQGKLAAFRTPGGHFRILADEFERFRKTHGFGQAAGEPPPRVLLVDDQREVAEVLVAALRGHDPRARMETAANGFEGLLKVGTFRPDVLLLDLGMPGMDGFEVCRQLKRDPVIRETKVVAMTDRALDAEPRAMEAGADGVLFKPLEAAAVRRLLVRLLGARR
jgi:excisionase family DNA binding protein